MRRIFKSKKPKVVPSSAPQRERIIQEMNRALAENPPLDIDGFLNRLRNIPNLNLGSYQSYESQNFIDRVIIPEYQRRFPIRFAEYIEYEERRRRAEFLARRQQQFGGSGSSKHKRVIPLNTEQIRNTQELIISSLNTIPPVPPILFKINLYRNIALSRIEYENTYDEYIRRYIKISIANISNYNSPIIPDDFETNLIDAYNCKNLDLSGIDYYVHQRIQHNTINIPSQVIRPSGEYKHAYELEQRRRNRLVHS